MFNDESRTIEEAYTSAASSSDLRCETRDGAPRSDTDLLIAAGWSPSRVGAALLRLHTEWDGAGHSRPSVGADFMHDAKARQPDAGKQTAAEVKIEADRLAKAQNEQQAMLLMTHLKTMPAVREQLILQLGKWSVEDADRIAGAVLRWWLAPNCRLCQGRKFELIQNTGRLSNKHCKLCEGSGKVRIPHGEVGRRLVNFMEDCVHISRVSMKKRLHQTMYRR